MVVTIVSKETVNVGESVNLLAGISATDTCGNDITDSIDKIGIT